LLLELAVIAFRPIYRAHAAAANLLEQAIRSDVIGDRLNKATAALRRAGCTCAEEVQAAILENNGAISVVPRSGPRADGMAADDRGLF